VGGEIIEGRPQSKGGKAYFKHSRSLQPKDVWRMRVEVGGSAYVGFATEKFNVEKHGETGKSIAWVALGTGLTAIYTDISQDGQDHWHHGHLRPHIPEAPFDLAVRCEAVSNLPQIQFNDDSVWHDFAPEGGTALKAGPWFSYLNLDGDDLLSDHRVDRPRATKSAGMKRKPAANPAPALAGDGAGAAAADGDDCAPPPQIKKARDAEEGSK
jgi:hypothetical protein